MRVIPTNKRLLSGIFALALSGCITGVHATEKQIADLEEDIAALKVELEEVSASGGAAAQLLSNIETAKAEIEKSRAELPEKEKALAAKSYLLGIYQSAFRVVTTMVAGENLGTLQLTNGEAIPGAIFLKTERGGIQVQTAAGTRSIPITQLPAGLSARIQLPPAIPAPAMNFEAVKATKPAFLQTKEEIAAAKTAAQAPAGGTVASTEAGASSEGAAPALSKADEFKQIQQRNADRQKRILEIKDRYAVLFAEKKKARTDKAAAEAGFRSAKIKKAKSEVDSTMDFHNSKIARIEEEEANLRREMLRIQSEFE